MKLTLKSLALSTTTVGLIFGAAQNAQAILITGVTASTDMGSLSGSNITNTVNGVGLPDDTPSLTGSHVVAKLTNAWVGNVTGNITFNLNGSYSLAGFSFWNFNNIVGGSTSSWGINDVTVQSSTDGTTFTTVAGAPTQFAIGAANAPENPQMFSFSPVTASYVRFVVGSNWGGTYSAFSEVQFDQAEAVPEPLTILGTGVVLGALPVLKKEYAKRKKKKKDGNA